jgi:hypothetical protein
MSGVVTAAVVASTVNSIYQGQKQASAQKKAAAQAEANANKQAKAADEANNRANQKRANPGAALDNAMMASKSGASGTMLTGSAGVDPGSLQLGRSTLLGG